LLATCSAKKDSLVGLLGEGVELGNGVVESLLGEVASTVWAVEDLVAELLEMLIQRPGNTH
jgi:hypothetical protein